MSQALAKDRVCFSFLFLAKLRNKKTKLAEADILKDGKIKEHLSSNQLIAVQVTKEPISSKGPRLSAEVTIPGRFLVLVPFSEKISVSQKIKDPKMYSSAQNPQHPTSTLSQQNFSGNRFKTTFVEELKKEWEKQ